MENSDEQRLQERWEQRVGHLLWETYTRAFLITEDEMAGSELTPAAIGTLDMVATWPGATVAEISRRTPKTQQAISQMVARLERLGYLERRLGKGRGVGIHLTDAGRAARLRGHELEDIVEQRYREVLGDQLYHQLEVTLGAARDRLRELGAEAVAPQRGS